jgi:hypothetical protein
MADTDFNNFKKNQQGSPVSSMIGNWGMEDGVQSATDP